MAEITDAGSDWSAGTGALATDEIWQCQEGAVRLSTEGSPGAKDGVILSGNRLDAWRISAGMNVKYKLASGNEAHITRTAV